VDGAGCVRCNVVLFALSQHATLRHPAAAAAAAAGDRDAVMQGCSLGEVL